MDERDAKRGELLLQLVGTTAALAAWAAVVGGMIMWARFRAAGVPETQGLTILPQQLLIAEGIRALALPVVLGILLAATGVLLYRRYGDRIDAVGERLLIAAIATAGVSALLALPFLVLVRFRYVVAIFIVTAATIAALLWALHELHSRALEDWRVRWKTREWEAQQGREPMPPLVRGRPGARALAIGLAVFAAVALWSGVVTILRELGTRDVRLDLAAVSTDSARRPWSALFIARTSDALYVARRGDTDPECRIQVVPAAAVLDLRIARGGGEGFCPTDSRGVRSPEAGTTVTTTVVEPGETVMVATGTVTVVPSTVTLPAETVTVTLTGPTVTDTQTQTVEIERPAGAHRLPNGVWSIPVASVEPPRALQISAPRYSRQPLTDTRPLTAAFTVTASGGYVVEGARVFVRALRHSYFRGTQDATTDENGVAQVRLQPTGNLPFADGVRIALFVRAWNPAEAKLVETSGRRLVQLYLGSRTSQR